MFTLAQKLTGGGDHGDGGNPPGPYLDGAHRACQAELPAGVELEVPVHLRQHVAVVV